MYLKSYEFKQFEFTFRRNYCVSRTDTSEVIDDKSNEIDNLFLENLKNCPAK